MSDNFVIAEMTCTEIDEALKERPVAILPVGSTQAHGPHLPVSTDTLVAFEVARRGALKLREQRIRALILPPLNYSVTDLSDGFAGTVSLSPDCLQILLRDLCLTLSKRFRAIALANVNLEVRQLDSIKKAIEEATKGGASVCHADFTKKRWAELLGEAFQDGDHGGAFVTSIVMAAAPDKVRDSVRRSLPPVDGLKPALKKGAKTFIEAGGEDAYFGDPTAATAEDGEGYLEALSEVLRLTVMEHLGSKA
jgi:creatinine amidohydrolase